MSDEYLCNDCGEHFYEPEHDSEGEFVCPHCGSPDFFGKEAFDALMEE